MEIVVRKRIYVCSPLRGDYAANQGLALKLSKAVCTAGGAPFTPHLLYTQFLDDNLHAERWAGIESGTSFLTKCDALWAYTSYGISEGMRKEIELANAVGVPVLFDPEEWKGIVK